MGRFSRSLLAFSMIAVGISAPTTGHAWDGDFTGRIDWIEVSQGNNYGFRVHLVGVTEICAGGTDWAFVNEADSNYRVFVATLLMAKANFNTVRIFTTAEPYPPKPDGLKVCRIGDIVVN